MQPYSPSWQRRRAASTWGGHITYRCRRCGASFDFNPTRDINVPYVLEKSGVPDKCKGKPL